MPARLGTKRGLIDMLSDERKNLPSLYVWSSFRLTLTRLSLFFASVWFLCLSFHVKRELETPPFYWVARCKKRRICSRGIKVFFASLLSGEIVGCFIFHESGNTKSTNIEALQNTYEYKISAQQVNEANQVMKHSVQGWRVKSLLMVSSRRKYISSLASSCLISDSDSLHKPFLSPFPFFPRV